MKRKNKKKKNKKNLYQPGLKGVARGGATSLPGAPCSPSWCYQPGQKVPI